MSSSIRLPSTRANVPSRAAGWDRAEGKFARSLLETKIFILQSRPSPPCSSLSFASPCEKVPSPTLPAHAISSPLSSNHAIPGAARTPPITRAPPPPMLLKAALSESPSRPQRGAAASPLPPPAVLPATARRSRVPPPSPQLLPAATASPGYRDLGRAHATMVSAEADLEVDGPHALL